MRTKLLSWIVLWGVAAFFAASAHAQQDGMVAGRIIAAKVKGTVTATNLADNSKQVLKDNDTISEKYVVTTGQDSSVILVFSNGSTINLAHDSTLSIEEFLQDPFSSTYAMATASEEPSTSVTKLNLSRGELVGNVKKLHQSGADGSVFTVNTPVGAAGIRGTTFRIVFRPDSNGKAFFTLSTSEGEVLLTGATAAPTSVPSGQEVVATVDVTINADGSITVNSPVQLLSEGMSAAGQAEIAAAMQEIVTNYSTLVFTSPTTSTTGNPLVPGQAPPTPQTPADQTTPGDGR